MKRNSLLKSVMFGFLSWFLPLGLNFVATPLIVRGLGVEKFGVYTLILGFVSYSFTFNVGRAIIKYVSEFRANNETEKISDVVSATLLLNLLVGGAGTTILCLFARWFVVSLLQVEEKLQNEAIIGFYFASVIIFTVMLTQSFSSIIQALHRFDVYSYLTIGSTSLLAVGNIVLIKFYPNIETLLIWNLTLSAIGSLLFYIYARRLLPELKLTLRFPRKILVLILKYSLAIVAAQILGNLLLLFERGWIANKFGAEAVTYYIIPLNLGIYIHAFISSLTLVLFPLTSEVKSLGDTRKLQTIYTKATKIVVVLAAFLALTLINGRVFILHLWLGDDFVRNSADILAVHAVTFGFLAVVIISFQTIEGAGFPNVSTAVIFGWVVLSIPLMILLTGNYGVWGAAAGRLAGEAVFIPAILYIEKKVFGAVLWEFWLRTLPVIACAVLFASLAQMFLLSRLPLSWINLLAGVAASGVIFALSLLLTGFLTGNEKQWLKNTFNEKVFRIT